MGYKIVIVEDDRSLADNIAKSLKKEGYETYTAYDGVSALKLIKDITPDVLILDLALPIVNGFHIAKKIIEDPIYKGKETQIIIITVKREEYSIMLAHSLGVFDYILKPFNMKTLVKKVKEAIYFKEGAGGEVKILDEVANKILTSFGSSESVREILSSINAAVVSDATVLIQGETGVGKSMLAKIIHELGKRKKKPFQQIDCCAIPNDLMESLLFGYEKGAFTGAEVTKRGLIEEANGGTVFFNDISNLPYDMQSKLLNVIEEKKVRRLGSNEFINLNIRVIADSNVPLDKLVKDGKFRSDLYYRLNEIVITLPPLRERVEDIAPLAQKFLEEVNKKYSMSVQIADMTLTLLKSYPWPGNIRELKNAISHAALIAKSIIYPSDLPTGIYEYLKSYKEPGEEKPVEETTDRETAERNLIIKTLEEVKYDKTAAAKRLGISRQALYKKLRKYNISL